MPLFGGIGQVGSILGSHLYPLTEGPAYSCVETMPLRLRDRTNQYFFDRLIRYHRRGFGGEPTFAAKKGGEPNDADALSSLTVSGAVMFLAALSALVLTVRRPASFGALFDPDVSGRSRARSAN